MRILYYIYSLPVGGAETVVAEYLCQLRQRGAQVLLVQDYRTESFLTHSLEEQGIPMVRLRGVEARADCQKGRPGSGALPEIQ